MSLEISQKRRLAIDRLAIGRREKHVLLAIESFADDAGRCWPSLRSISDRSKYCERAIRNAMKRLREKGLLVIHREYGKVNRYTIQIPTLGATGTKDQPSMNPVAIVNDKPERNPGTRCRGSLDELPPDPGTKCRGTNARPRHAVPVTPAPNAGHPGTECRRTIPRTNQELSSSSGMEEYGTREEEYSGIVKEFWRLAGKPDQAPTDKEVAFAVRMLAEHGPECFKKLVKLVADDVRREKRPLRWMNGAERDFTAKAAELDKLDAAKRNKNAEEQKRRREAEAGEERRLENDKRRAEGKKRFEAMPREEQDGIRKMLADANPAIRGSNFITDLCYEHVMRSPGADEARPQVSDAPGATPTRRNGIMGGPAADANRMTSN